MKISICYPCVNEPAEAILTARSIRETAGNDVEICVCDDASAETISFPPELNVRVHRNFYRIGSGGSRHVLGLMATGDYLMITDCHVRFEKHWSETALEYAAKFPNAAFCAVCKGFTPTVKPFTDKPSGIYYGADLQFIGKNPNGQNTQVLESVWAKECDDEAERQSLLGANYFISRKRFNELSAMNFLRCWGVEEQSLSLKLWLSGDEIRLMKRVTTWHRFRDGERMPFRNELWSVLFNKIFTIETIFPDAMKQCMIAALPRCADLNKAQDKIREDWRLIEAEREKNKRMFVRDCDWLLNKFQIPLL